MDPYYAKLAPFIGHIVIEHGNLEGDAGRMIARLNGKGDDVSAAKYAARCSFHQKIILGRKLLDTVDMEEEVKSEFLAVLDEMQRINRLRNRFIHSEYLPELDKDNKIIGAHQREIKQMGDVVDMDDPESEIKIYRVDERELRTLIRDMSDLGLRIRVISEKFFDSLPYEPPPLKL